MKTGLVTFHCAHHYGAMLQAYALCESIRAVTGHCEIVDYRRADSVRESRILQRSLKPSALLKNAHSLLHYPEISGRFKRFAAFAAETMPQSPKRYTDSKALAQDPPIYERLVCGSDQIWNPRLFPERRFDPAYLLHFATDAVKIAYAPSFGAAELTEAEREELRAHLAGFAWLSAREPHGAALIEEITGFPAEVTLDPTLLLKRDDWAKLARGKMPAEPYILCYFVNRPGFMEAQAAAVRARYPKAPFWQLAGTRRPLSGVDKVILDAGPREFLSLFQNAAFVLTNSFHGTVFALQFGKPFLCAAGGGEGGDPARSRIGSLLEALGLSDCMVSAHTKPGVSGVYDDALCAVRLGQIRAQSAAYLRNALLN